VIALLLAVRVAIFAPGIEPPVEKALEDAIGKIAELQFAAGGKKAGAQKLLSADEVKVGSGRVIYLQCGDGSASVTIGGEAGEVAGGDQQKLRAALARILDSEHYRGRVALKVDVPGAEVYVDAKKQKQFTVELTVGTHAIRVTHPQYRDFLRFVDVDYDQTLEIAVALSAYPLAEGEMSEKLRKAPPKAVVPWWRSWWALTILGVAITGVTVGAVWGARPTLSPNATVGYKPPTNPF
jgi:hypothetical protein